MYSSAFILQKFAQLKYVVLKVFSHWELSDTFFITDVWNQFVQNFNARVKILCLIGLFIPPVASETVIKVTIPHD